MELPRLPNVGKPTSGLVPMLRTLALPKSSAGSMKLLWVARELGERN